MERRLSLQVWFPDAYIPAFCKKKARYHFEMKKCCCLWIYQSCVRKLLLWRLIHSASLLLWYRPAFLTKIHLLQIADQTLRYQLWSMNINTLKCFEELMRRPCHIRYYYFTKWLIGHKQAGGALARCLNVPTTSKCARYTTRTHTPCRNIKGIWQMRFIKKFWNCPFNTGVYGQKFFLPLILCHTGNLFE